MGLPGSTRLDLLILQPNSLEEPERYALRLGVWSGMICLKPLVLSSLVALPRLEIPNDPCYQLLNKHQEGKHTRIPPRYVVQHLRCSTMIVVPTV